MKRWRTRAAAALSVAVLSLVTGCSTVTGGGDDADVPQELVVAAQYPIENLDPHGAAAQDSGTQLAAKAIFSALVKITGDGKFEGVLAEKWETNADGTQWTFTLRDGLKFSDDKPLTSADVVASMTRVKTLAGPAASNFAAHTLSAPDAKTVVFTSKTPDPALLGKLITFYVTPAEQDKAGWTKPVGSGPFVIDTFTPGQSLALKPNPRYWGAKPKLQRVEIRSIGEISARMTALKTGEVHLAWAMPDDQLPGLRSNPDLAVELASNGAVLTMWMNSKTKGLGNPAVRKALWQAVDFATIIKSLYPESGKLADSVVGPQVLGYAPQTPVKYDPTAAKAALTAAGWDFNQVIRFQFAQPQHQQFTDAVASDLAKIGVKVEPVQKEQAVFLKDLLALNWDLNIQQLGTAGFDAATSLGRLYTCKANRMGYCNPALDTILAQAGSITDRERRQELYAQANKIIWDDAVGMYPMSVQIPYARNKAVKGLALPLDSVPDFSTVSMGSGDQ